MDKPTSARFNGTVNTDEGVVKVVEGYAVIGEDFFLVSNDGKVVTDKEGSVVAVVEKGKAQPLTPEIIDQLRRKGYV
tara:strand:- start:357 stop:587 length:231 start_codon:yes stop_codon:yes gene_type:complete